jgi:hypothetical protein
MHVVMATQCADKAKQELVVGSNDFVRMWV